MTNFDVLDNQFLSLYLKMNIDIDGGLWALDYLEYLGKLRRKHL